VVKLLLTKVIKETIFIFYLLEKQMQKY